MSIAVGLSAEALAATYLEQQGLILLQRNFRCRRGEIDLIMQDASYLVFVEVRYRKNTRFGGALGSIDWHKQQRIINAATYFLHQQRWAAQLPCRFDVVALTNLEQPSAITWIKDAFQLE